MNWLLRVVTCIMAILSLLEIMNMYFQYEEGTLSTYTIIRSIYVWLATIGLLVLYFTK